jgi:hypothetical protein
MARVRELPCASPREGAGIAARVRGGKDARVTDVKRGEASHTKEHARNTTLAPLGGPQRRQCLSRGLRLDEASVRNSDILQC